MKRISRLIALPIAFCIGCNLDQTPTQQSRERTTAGKSESTQSEPTTIENDWSFKVAPDTAAISLKRIMDGSHSILYVVHDENGDWQFLDGDEVFEEDAATVSLKNVVELDPSITSLADLPRDWAAERSAVGQGWKRFRR